MSLATDIRFGSGAKGFVVSKPLLAQLGLAGAAEMTIVRGAIVLRKPTKRVRAGWAEAARGIAVHPSDGLAMGEFSNEGDAELVW